jgi:hypothetical protein
MAMVWADNKDVEHRISEKRILFMGVIHYLSLNV